MNLDVFRLCKSVKINPDGSVSIDPLYIDHVEQGVPLIAYASLTVRDGDSPFTLTAFVDVTGPVTRSFIAPLEHHGDPRFRHVVCQVPTDGFPPGFYQVALRIEGSNNAIALPLEILARPS